MATNSKIEWTNATWNPVTGCTKVSPGCQNCYAERMAKRIQAIYNKYTKAGLAKYKNGFQVSLHPEELQKPLIWRKPRMIFVVSMGDLFHQKVPEDFIRQVFNVMVQAQQHTFQVLTKRAERLAELALRLPWSKNVWAGVTVENADYLWRVDYLKEVPAIVRFLSLEPLLGPISNLNLQGINWVIVGGESGPRARVMRKEWVIEIRNQCIDQSVPFFFKQWGGVNKKKTGRFLEGRIWEEMPTGQGQ